MRANPVLGELSQGDLSQRYEQSYAVYKGMPVYIQGFIGGRPVNIAAESIYRETREEKRISLTEPFNWRELDVERPNAGWYLVDTFDGVKPVYFSYPIRRQWKRGLCPRNTSMISPFTEIPKGEAFYSVLSHNMGNLPGTITMQELLDTQGTFIPRPNVLLTKVSKELCLFLGTQKVAIIEPKKKIIRRLEWLDDIEVKEVLWAPDFSIVPIPGFSKMSRMNSVHGNRLRAVREEVPRPEDEFFPEPEQEELDDERDAQRVLTASLLSIFDRGGDIVKVNTREEVEQETFKFITELWTTRDDRWLVDDGHPSHNLRAHNARDGALWTIARAEGWQGSLLDIHKVPIAADAIDQLLILHKLWWPADRLEEPNYKVIRGADRRIVAVIVGDYVGRADFVRFQCHLYWNALGDF